VYTKKVRNIHILILKKSNNNKYLRGIGLPSKNAVYIILGSDLIKVSLEHFFGMKEPKSARID